MPPTGALVEPAGAPVANKCAVHPLAPLPAFGGVAVAGAAAGGRRRRGRRRRGRLCRGQRRIAAKMLGSWCLQCYFGGITAAGAAAPVTGGFPRAESLPTLHSVS